MGKPVKFNEVTDRRLTRVGLANLLANLLGMGGYRKGFPGNGRTAKS